MVVAQAAPAAVLVALATLFIVVASAETENLLVTCGSSIKLQHVATKHRLHSHQVAYSRGSQQQSVTAYATGDDANSVWVVRGPEDAQCQPGTAFKKGQRIKLQHNPTRKWLHSHQFQSPLSGNQEVSAFGSDTETDGGDHWTIEWEGKAKVWKQETKVRFKHVDTGAYLYAHDMKYGNPIAGQLEVCATHRKDRNAEWQAAEGVYMPAAGKNGKGAAIDKEEL